MKSKFKKDPMSDVVGIANSLLLLATTCGILGVRELEISVPEREVSVPHSELGCSTLYFSKSERLFWDILSGKIEIRSRMDFDPECSDSMPIGNFIAEMGRRR